MNGHGDELNLNLVVERFAEIEILRDSRIGDYLDRLGKIGM